MATIVTDRCIGMVYPRWSEWCNLTGETIRSADAQRKRKLADAHKPRLDSAGKPVTDVNRYAIQRLHTQPDEQML